MITFPVMLFIYILLFKLKTFKKYISLFSVLFIIFLFYLFIRLFIFKPNYGTYHFVFDKSIISSYRFFVLFFLNWAETMKDQMLSFYRVNPRFLASFPYEVYSFVANAVIFLAVFIILPIIYFLKNMKYRKSVKQEYRIIIFAVLWFIINLLPIIFIPSHISPHQGTIALFGFLLIFFVCYDRLKQYVNKYLYAVVIFLLGISWILSSFAAISLDDRVHWIKRRSDYARQWIGRIKAAFPHLPANSLVQIPTEDKEMIVALGDRYGIKAVYGDDTLGVIYSTSSSRVKGIRVVP